MKKILLALLLVLCMLFSIVACDNASTDDKDKDPDGKENETTEQKVDNKEDNIKAIADMINNSKELGSALENSGELNASFDISAEDILKALDEFEGDSSLSVTANGETVSGYLGYKDRVGYAKIDGEGEFYIFVEDDLKLVGIESYEGELYGSVEDSLAVMLESLKELESVLPGEGSASDAIPDEYSAMVDQILSFKLPEIKAEDITYKDGKYVISVEYIKTAVESLLNIVLTEDMGMSAEDIVNTKSLIRGYIDKMGLELYFYMEYEQVTGFGIAVDLEEEFAAEILGMTSVKAMIDIHNSELNVVAYIADAENVYCDCSAKVKAKTNNKGELSGVTLDLDLKFLSSDYYYDEDLDEYVEIENTINVKADMMLDVEKFTSDGDIFTLTVEMSDSQGYELDLEAELSSSNKGSQFSGGFEMTSKDDGETEKVSASITLDNKADKMPTVPQNVLDEKEAALEEYNNPVYDWEEDWEEDWDEYETYDDSADEPIVEY